MRSANNIRGIYLPFLFDPSVCSLDPLPLYYANSHFCALVGVDDSLPLPGLIPLREKTVCLQISASNEVSKVVVTEHLPLRFHTVSETSLSRDERIHRYLDIQVWHRCIWLSFVLLFTW